MKIQILVAHPDDEVIICGGTIDKLVERGHKVYVTFYTKNQEAYYGDETSKNRSIRAIKEAKKSSELLHFEPNFLNFSDMHVEENKAVLIKETIKEIRRVKPDLIITHYFKDKHIDHRTLGEIVGEANFQSGCELCGGNTTWSASAVLQGEVNLEMTTPFNYSVVSKFAKHNLNNKIKSFNIYESVFSEHGNNSDWLNKKLQYTAELRGKSVGAAYGEAFIIDNYSPLGGDAIEKIAQILK